MVSKLLKKMKVKQLKHLVKKHKVGKITGLKKSQLVGLLVNHPTIKDILKDFKPVIKKKKLVSSKVLERLRLGREKRKANLLLKKGIKKVVKEVVKVEKKLEKVPVVKDVIKEVIKPVVEKVVVPVLKPLTPSVIKEVIKNIDNKQEKKIEEKKEKVKSLPLERKENILKKLKMLDEEDIDRIIMALSLKISKLN